MKKITFFHLFVLFAIVLIALSCNKSEVPIPFDSFLENENNDDLRQNEATWATSSEENTKFWFLKIKISIGHTPADCGNKCVKILGELGHIDCRGFGNVCNHIVNARVIQSDGNLKLVLENPEDLGMDLDFLLPDRTLFITNPLNNADLWLNIPEQVLWRDNHGVPFEILDIWFSEEPELENK